MSFPRNAVTASGYGSLYFSTPIVTTTAAIIAIKAKGTTTASQLHNFTHTDNRLTFTGSSGTFMATASISISSSGATQSQLHFFKNDALVPGSSISRKISTGGDIGAVTTSSLITFITGDYVELWVETDDGDSLTVETGCLSIVNVG